MKRQLINLVETETVSAQAMYLLKGTRLETDHLSPECWMTVLNEEVGKLNRAVNKLRISVDGDISQQWETEGHRRIVTSMSVLTRLWEVWPVRGGHVGGVAGLE